MRVAVCYSGLVREHFERNFASLRRHFPTEDVFFGVWAGRDKPPGVRSPWVFQEPVPHYHPYANAAVQCNDIKWQIYRQAALRLDETGHRGYTRTLHQCKQILAHAHMLERLPAHYDMVVRVRYDTFFSRHVDFRTLLRESYDRKQAIGFATRSGRHRNLHALCELPQEYETPDQVTQHGDWARSFDWSRKLLDVLIFHPRELFDVQRVRAMYRDRLLWAAEFGWYQVLGEPHGDSHHCFYGGVQTNAYLRKHPGFDQ